MYVVLAVLGFSFAACGNSQKKAEKVMEKKKVEQPMDTVTFIETETVVVIDSLATDSINKQKHTNQSSKKTK